MSTKTKRLGADAPVVGYCTRCGGDCRDDGVTHYHRCPPKRPEAHAVVAVKSAAAKTRKAMDCRPWSEIMRKEDCDELRAALDDLAVALGNAYP